MPAPVTLRPPCGRTPAANATAVRDRPFSEMPMASQVRPHDSCRRSARRAECFRPSRAGGLWVAGERDRSSHLGGRSRRFVSGRVRMCRGAAGRDECIHVTQRPLALVNGECVDRARQRIEADFARHPTNRLGARLKYVHAVSTRLGSGKGFERFVQAAFRLTKRGIRESAQRDVAGTARTDADPCLRPRIAIAGRDRRGKDRPRRPDG